MFLNRTAMLKLIVKEGTGKKGQDSARKGKDKKGTEDMKE